MGRKDLHWTMQHQKKDWAFICSLCGSADCIVDGLQTHYRRAHKREVKWALCNDRRITLPIIYEKLLKCGNCPEYRDWSEEGMDGHLLRCHPAVYKQREELREESRRRERDMTAAMASVELGAFVAPVVEQVVVPEVKVNKVKVNKVKVEKVVREEVNVMAIPTPRLELSEEQKARAYASECAREKTASYTVVKYGCRDTPEFPVLDDSWGRDVKDTGTQVVVNQGLFVGLTHDVLLKCEMFVELSDVTTWLGSIYFDCDLPVKQVLYFGLQPRIKKGEFMLYPHPGSRACGWKMSSPMVDQASRYRGEVVRTQGVYEITYVMCSRLKPVAGKWRVFHGGELLGTATVRTDKMALFKL